VSCIVLAGQCKFHVETFGRAWTWTSPCSPRLARHTYEKVKGVVGLDVTPPHKKTKTKTVSCEAVKKLL